MADAPAIAVPVEPATIVLAIYAGLFFALGLVVGHFVGWRSGVRWYRRMAGRVLADELARKGGPRG